MSNRPDVQTPELTRDQLAMVFKNDRIRRAFESLLKDTTAVIPDAIQEVGDHADDIEGFLNGTNATAQEALALARVGLQEELTAAIAELRERVAVLELAVANLKEGPNP